MSKSSFSFNFNVEKKLNSIVAINSYIPENSYSADLLGTERSGHGIVIREDGLIVTIGYVITEAESIWISTSDSDAVPGYIVGNDYESGLGLIKPMTALNLPKINCGKLKELNVDDSVLIAGHGGLGYMMESSIVAIKEFAGRWEYILDEAIYTSPAHPNWAGAALIGEDGNLYGIGCLLIQDVHESEIISGNNLFVPIETIFPYIEEISQYGARKKKPLPWLGFLLQEEEENLVITGIFTGCPADKAGLKLGDKISLVDHKPVNELATFFRAVWDLGESGIEVPLTVIREAKHLEIIVHSSDRESSFRRGPIN